MQLGYDPLGRLSWTTGSPNFTRFLYDGDALVAEYDYAGTIMIKRYAHWVGADVPLVSYEGASLETATARWLFTDHQGSIIAAAHPSGATAWVNTYDEYGIPGAGNTGRFQYTGQIWLQELGMYHYKARIYSPTLGRFLQTDPIGYADQYNLYAYVGNDPVGFRDSSGTRSEPLPEGCGTRIRGSNRCSGMSGAEYDELVASIGSHGAHGPNAYGGGKGDGKSTGPVQPRTFLPPTNPPSFPPVTGEYYFEDGAVWAPGPNGSRYRFSGPNRLYPNGSWRQQVGNQYVDPSTGRPPGNVSRAEFNARTHVPMPEVRDPPYRPESSWGEFFFRGFGRVGGAVLCILICESPAH